MNKTTIISNINGFISVVIRLAGVRNSYLELINTFWSTIVTNTKTTTSLTPQSITSTTYTWLNYLGNFKREGNKVFITGWIENKATNGFTYSGFTAFTITDSLYNAKTGNDTLIILNSDSGDSLLASFSGNTLNVIGSLPPNKKYYINGFYYTND